MTGDMVRDDPLSHELNVYETKKREWLNSHLNEFVVIAGDRIEGFHDTYESAFKAAIKAFGVEKQFLIKQVCATEPVYVVY